MLSIQTPSTLLFCGKTRSGKSHLMKYILYGLCKSAKFQYGLCICPTAVLSGDYDWLPSKLRHQFYSDELILKIFAYQEKNGKKPMFLILDDCIGSANWNSAVMKRLLTTSRHYGITIFIATQYMSSIPAIAREQMTYMCIFAQYTARSIKACHESFCQDKTLAEFTEWMTQNTRNYAFLFREIGSDPSPMRAPALIPKFELLL